MHLKLYSIKVVFLYFNGNGQISRKVKNKVNIIEKF